MFRIHQKGYLWRQGIRVRKATRGGLPSQLVALLTDANKEFKEFVGSEVVSIQSIMYNPM